MTVGERYIVRVTLLVPCGAVSKVSYKAFLFVISMIDLGTAYTGSWIVVG